MAFPAKIAEHKGKSFVHVSHTGLRGPDLLASLRKATVYLRSQKEAVLFLADFTDTPIDGEAMAYLKTKEAVEGTNNTLKSAVVGITGIKQVFLNAFNALSGVKVRAFTSEAEAKDFLVS
jgi:hypothetical protein